MGGVVSWILCVALVVGAVGIGSFWEKSEDERKEAAAQLQELHAAAEAREVSDLLEALYLPPEVVNMDAGYRRDAKEMRLRMFRRQERDKVVDMSNLLNYPKHWDSYKQVPLQYSDPEKGAIGSFEWRLYNDTGNCEIGKNLVSHLV